MAQAITHSNIEHIVYVNPPNIFNNSLKDIQISGSTVENLAIFESNNNLIKLENTFTSQYNKMKYDLEPNVSEDFIFSLFERNVRALLNLNPEQISVEISYENSIIFTFIKYGLTCFIEQYFYEEKDEIIYNSFFQDEKKSNFDGNFASFISHFKNELKEISESMLVC